MQNVCEMTVRRDFEQKICKLLCGSDLHTPIVVHVLEMEQRFSIESCVCGTAYINPISAAHPTMVAFSLAEKVSYWPQVLL